MGTPGDRRSHPVENRFRDALERESMDETLSEAGEEMKLGNTADQDPAERDFTTHELLQDLSGDDWANTATPPLGSPRKDLELTLASDTSSMGMILLSAEESKKNAFEGDKWMILNTLDEKTWQDFLSEFSQRVDCEVKLEDFKEELWNTVVKFRKPVLMATGLDEKARKELLEKMISLREPKQKIKADACKDSSTLNKKPDDKRVRDDKDKTSNRIKINNFPEAREGGGKSWRNRTWIKKSNQ